MGDIRAVADWLIESSAPFSESVLAELCRRMIDGSIPLWRVAVFVNTLHPDVYGRAFVWHPETGVTMTEALYDITQTEEFRTSPVTAIRASRQPIRRHLAMWDCPDDFPVVGELRAQGATDYAALPLFFTDGSVHVATWATRQPGGFTPEQLADLDTIVGPLTRVAEIRALRRTATNLLDTYVGRQAGERILMGEIRRGHVEAIRAAIWLSDMRGFTALSERLPPQELVDLLNRYFDCQVLPIYEHGGEVLKFMGDGLLAIFPLAADGDNPEDACRRALTSAREARALTETLDKAVGSENDIRFGLALHVGQVMYGNIGGGSRLDFTCIGPAVNLAARIEKIAARHGHTVVASADFAGHFQDEFVPLGEFDVAGFAAPQAVFTLADSSASAAASPA
jgi:adenylate cyclase